VAISEREEEVVDAQNGVTTEDGQVGFSF